MPTNTPDDPLAAETPRDFPEAMRRADPLLVAEDTNGVYMAFKRRRAYADLSGWRRWRHWVPYAESLSIIAGMTMLVISERAILGSNRVSFVLAALGLIALGWSSTILALRQHITPDTGRRVLPVGPSELLPAPAASRAVLEDLWQAGMTGGDLLEASYLEARYRQVQLPQLRFTLHVYTAAALACWMADQLLFTVAGLFVTAAMITLAVSWLRAERLYSQPTYFISRTLTIWMAKLEEIFAHPRDIKFHTRFGRIFEGKFGTGYWMAMIFSQVGAHAGIFYMSGRRVAGTPLHDDLLFVVACACIGLAILLWNRRNTAHAERIADFREALNLGTKVFDPYMRFIVLNDWDPENKPRYIKYTDETWNQR